WKWKVPNPVSDIELPKVNNARVRYLTPEECKKLFDKLDEMEMPYLKPFVIIGLETGLRLSNLCDLSWSEVNLFSRMITINAEKMKNGDYIGIPLSERAHATLMELQKVRSMSDYVFHDNGQKLYPVKVQRAFKAALKSAEIENFRFHDLRHTFASLLVQNGADIYAVQKLLGHKDGRMTQRYAHLSVDALRNAIAKLNVTFQSRPAGYGKAESM
ncbi:MAG TPA: site-specific integrase, partial [Dissulfurispiraceae bacterium]